jgi:5-methylcytosine-specific restriction enzyme subunit McrC
MSKPIHKIQVFEHQTPIMAESTTLFCLKENHFNALAKLNEYHDNKYFM